jgi:tRNA(fMet)-specific endonuclease VapC
VTYLVDTDRVASFLNGLPAVTELLTDLAPLGLSISLITYGEIYDGIYGGRDPADAEPAFRQFLRVVDVLPLNRSVMRRFALKRSSEPQRVHDRHRPAE